MIQLGNDRTISVLSRSMDAAAERQKVTSNNIANVNTPGYKRQYVDFESRLHQAIVRDEAVRGKIYRTHEKHIPVRADLGNIRAEINTDKTGTMREDGNNVDVDLELALLAENTIRFNVLSESAARKFSGLRSVIRGG